MSKLVVPFRSHWEVKTVVEECGLETTLLLVLVPGVDEGGCIVPAPSVRSEDIPHVPGVPSHIVPVGEKGEFEDFILGPEDRIILTKETPVTLVWAAAQLAANLGPDSVGVVDGTRIDILVPVIPEAILVEQ